MGVSQDGKKESRCIDFIESIFCLSNISINSMPGQHEEFVELCIKRYFHSVALLSSNSILNWVMKS